MIRGSTRLDTRRLAERWRVKETGGGMVWYETDEDINNEQAIMQSFLERTGKKGYSFEKLPIDLALDFAIINPQGHVCAAFEVKHRRTRYDTVILSMNKIRMGRWFEDEGIPAFFLISMPDDYGKATMYSFRIGETALNYCWGGRASRDKREPLADIPISYFMDLGPMEDQ